MAIDVIETEVLKEKTEHYLRAHNRFSKGTLQFIDKSTSICANLLIFFTYFERPKAEIFQSFGFK